MDSADKDRKLSESEESDKDDDDADEVEETAEVLMTDMTLEDDVDKMRDSEPGSTWIYHIEAYPWSADDINEHFIRLIKLASFTKLTMRKKPMSHDSEDDFKLMERQRKGSLHLYAETYQTAKAIMRHTTWRGIKSKEITFEITKRSLESDSCITARMDVETRSMSKVRFREKVRGSFKARSAKVSNLPATVTRDFLDIIFCRSCVAYDGEETELYKDNKEMNLQQMLGDIPNFDGSLDLDCVHRGSCREFVLAHKNVVIGDNELSIKANDDQTMVAVPVLPDTQSVGMKVKEENRPNTSTTGLASPITTGRGRGVSQSFMGRAGSLTRINSPASYTIQSARIHPMAAMGRARGMVSSRGMAVGQQPASTSFPRPGPSMPIPMTGRQKMNEKIRRNHPNIVIGAQNTGIHPGMGTSTGFRNTNMRSMGDAFKQEIASLQSELERSTQAIEAKIERLREESNYYNNYNEEVQMYEEGDWDEGADYEFAESQSDYLDDGQGQDNFYDQSYDAQSLDALGYELSYEQYLEAWMNRGGGQAQRRVAGRRGRGSNPHAPVQRIMSSALDHPVDLRNSRQIRSGRGRGSGMLYQGPGSSSYW